MRSEKFNNVAKFFDYILVHLRQKVRLKPEIFVNFRPKPGPNSTRKARPDLQLCFEQAGNSLDKNSKKKHRSIRLLETSKLARIPPIVK